MVVKKAHAAVSDEANTVNSETKVEQKAPKKVLDQAKNKWCVNRCLDNPWFPWMIIALLFTLLVIMFWREHYSYWMWKKQGWSMYNREWRMDDNRPGPMMERWEQMRRWGSEQSAPAQVLPE